MDKKKRRRGIGCLTLIVLVVVGGFWLASLGGSASADNVLTAAAMGEEWPFVDGVDEVRVICEPGNVVVAEIDGQRYTVNGLAMAKYAELTTAQEAGLVAENDLGGGVVVLKDAVSPLVAVCLD